MLHTVHISWIDVLCIVLMFSVVVVWIIDGFRQKRHFREQLEDYPDPPRIWKCHRSQGGGVCDTPRPMTKGEATEWCAQTLGVIMYVDEEHAFIFYRAD